MTVPLQERTSSSDVPDRSSDVIPRYRAWLEQQGLGPGLIAQLVNTAWHLITWLAACGTGITALDIRRIAEFVSHDCACQGRFRPLQSRYARLRANRFLTWLLDTGQVAMPALIVEGCNIVDALISTLVKQGYSHSTMRQYSHACRHFVVWLYRADLTLDQIDDGVIQRFLDHDCDCACPHFLPPVKKFDRSFATRARVEQFADCLVRTGVIKCWREAISPPPRSDLVNGFLDWMRCHRGARESTICEYDRILHRKVLPVLGHDPTFYDVRTIRAAFAHWAQIQSSSALSNTATALRGYMRYLGANGLCRPALANAVPTVRRQRAAALPRYVSEAAIEALIASCNTATPAGMRDRAILLLLARLALRAGDIVALRLDDIDWEQARVRVGGKSRRHDVLPLPQDAGDAVKIYILRSRPRIQNDAVFLRVCAPHGPLSRGDVVSSIVRRAMGRAGIDGTDLPAAHLFRHSRATNLLRSGASLQTVAALLRHQSVETTTLYARVDTPMLMEVAQPWPGDVP